MGAGGQPPVARFILANPMPAHRAPHCRQFQALDVDGQFGHRRPVCPGCSQPRQHGLLCAIAMCDVKQHAGRLFASPKSHRPRQAGPSRRAFAPKAKHRAGRRWCPTPSLSHSKPRQTASIVSHLNVAAQHGAASHIPACRPSALRARPSLMLPFLVQAIGHVGASRVFVQNFAALAHRPGRGSRKTAAAENSGSAESPSTIGPGNRSHGAPEWKLAARRLSFIVARVAAPRSL